MATATRSAPLGGSRPRSARSERTWRLEALVLATLALATVVLADPRKGHAGELPDLLRGAAAALVLFWLSGAALARVLTPDSLRPLRDLFAIPLGAMSSALTLTALGIAHMPLKVSLWLVLAAGVAGLLLLRRRTRAAASEARTHRPSEPPGAPSLRVWLAVLALIALVGVIPAWRTGAATIYGQNPDAHQVAGIAVLFQHVSPTGTDVALPVDTVPPNWRFRYPIFYPLAAVANLSHLDPIQVFAVMAAALLALVALGFGAFAVRCLRAPRWAGPPIGAAVALTATTLHLVWHPYWNQLWGLAMLPYALLFGWIAVEEGDGRAAGLFVLVLVMLGLAYPLALPYPLVIVGALAAPRWRDLRMPRQLRTHAWAAGLIGLLVLTPALIGAAIKLGQGLSQLLSSHSALWGGDIKHFMPVGKFLGTGGGIVPALLIAGLAVPALVALPRRAAWPLGVTLALLCLLDLRFRLASTGSYMDFKHLSFVGVLVVALAACTVARRISSGSRSWMAAGALVAIGWGIAAGWQDHREIAFNPVQATPEMFQIRRWAAELPRGASVRVDVPPSGVQLWAVYMLASHPVDALQPVGYTTYAHAPAGLRAEYSLSLRYYPSPDLRIRRPFPPVGFAQGAPLFANDQFVVRRIVWPRRYDYIPDTSSLRLVGP